MDTFANARLELKRDLALEILRSCGEARLPVAGASMLPAVWPGDILCIRSHEAEGALPGEIVVFEHGGRLVSHRVVKRTAGAQGIQWLTRGDMADRDDPPVSSHEMLGRVTVIERGRRRIAPRFTLWGRAASWVLRRSEFATRLVLWMRSSRVPSPKESHP